MTWFLSLDLETAGLEPQHSILEVGCVLFNRDTAHELSFLVQNGLIVGDPYALAMNSKVLYEIDAAYKAVSKGWTPATPIVSEQDVNGTIAEFIRTHEPTRKVTLCGKNVGSFDINFLKDTFQFRQHLAPLLNHAVLDVGPMFMLPDDEYVPKLATCMERAGMTNRVVTHRAVEDARIVMELIRRKLWNQH